MDPIQLGDSDGEQVNDSHPVTTARKSSKKTSNLTNLTKPGFNFKRQRRLASDEHGNLLSKCKKGGTTYNADSKQDKGEDADGTQIDDNEPTMADKLATLDLEKKGGTNKERSQPFLTQPPSADSVHVLLRQALHADDRALLLDCLYNQDDKVITNSVSLLNAVDIFKLLDCLLSIIQSRGAVLVCALPWLRSLLLQHSSRIISQESSLTALNSLYQLIETRVANLNPALQLAASVDLLFAGVDDEGMDEYDSAPPVIYEDNDESEEEEESEDEMETDEKTKEPEDFSGLSDADLSEGFST